ncbi:MAG: endonuclease/exonuclease/phosphatase family protein [Actinobacteria bacterium]|nr:endonuclease/exonuclease/phosphatase family protein [Actinomycetota bacterium]
MRIISYNLRKHRAVHELGDLVEANDPDVLCLQEGDTLSLPESVGGLVLAHTTQNNRLGLAIYYRASAFNLVDMAAVSVKKSLHDRVLRPAHERLLGVRLRDIDAGRDVLIASLHAAPLTARNALRRDQIRAALSELSELGWGLPQLIVGDFNYPVFKERLSEHMRDVGYELVMSDHHTYTRYRVFRGFYDFAAASGFVVESVRTLPQGESDHLPILVTATPR